MQKVVDFLVIGSGIAGLSYALKVSRYGKVCLVTKNSLEDSATIYAQGGIASVTYQPDSYEKHINDTLVAGCFLNREEVVRTVVSEGPERIQELIEWGTHFDKNRDGKFDLAKEGGHTEYRVLHSKDSTGREIQLALIHQVKQNSEIEVLDNHFAIDLITQHHLGHLVKRIYNDIECYGAYVQNRSTREIITILSKTTLLATGGAGNVYQNTTNPSVATGDGIAMVYRAKGIIDDMEFFQFHPTALYHPVDRPSFLITEALRGHGAILKNQKGREFMQKYDSRASLAPRDIVARAIDNEMKLSGDDYVCLDATGIAANELKEKFPNIYKKCSEYGIDITKDYIPVTPAAHYMCGGIATDINGQSSINFLYAAGEVAATGLHGANRLASNSLLEAVVFSHRAAEKAIQDISNSSIKTNIPDWDDSGTIHNEEMVLITQSLKEMRQIMSNYVGIVRSDLRLQRAFVRLEILFRETEALYKSSKITPEICELRNMINISYLIIKMAMARKKSIGLHYNIDHQ